jgi:hypothetical protein
VIFKSVPDFLSPELHRKWTMNHDDDTSRRSPARELMPYDGLKRTWNDDSTTTTTASTGRTGGGGGGGRATSNSNKRPRGILAQFESISVHDDDNDKDDDDDDFHPDVSLIQDDNAMDNSGDVAGAGSRDRYSSSSLSRADENVDEYSYRRYQADDGIDRFSCDNDDEDDDDEQDDDEELLSDEELFKRRLEKQVYVYTRSRRSIDCL